MVSPDPPSRHPSTPAWQALGRALSHGPWTQRPAAIRAAWQDLLERQASLELWLEGECRQRLPLGADRCRIGRSPLCELQADTEGVSRVHCFVQKERDSDRNHSLEDFHSANGVFWHDQRIRSIRLRHGDEIQLGSPLKAASPTLRYCHPPSSLERLARLAGLGALLGSTLLIGGLLAASTMAGGSRIRAIGGPVKIYAANGQQIDAREGSATALPSLFDYPPQLRRALLASEDARFGWNSGLDLFGTLRSVLRRSGGGSGITQQVARIYYPAVGNDYSLARKLRELWVAWQLETGFSKNRILKMYLDRAHLGMGVDGFEQGARLYFRKSARELDLAESAFLVGLLPSPNGYSPCNKEHPTWGRERRDLVLARMHEEGAIREQELLDARRRPLNIDPSACRESAYTSYPFFSDYVIGELEGRRHGLNLRDRESGGNYYVVSTIDPRLQGIAQQQVRSFLESTAAPAGLTQAALISLDTRSGEILAYVGGGDYSRSSFDRVQAMRQPGSTFKLFPFLKALEAGTSPAAAISCAPLAYVEGCSHGPVGANGTVSVTQGFADSENVVALRLAEQVGFSQVIRMARRLGISTPLESSFSMVLGGNETYLYEMARAYAVVANGGRTVPMHGVTRIYDLGICQSVLSLQTCPQRGVTVPIGEKSERLIDPAVASQMDDLLRQVVVSGTGRQAAVIADARGKTGTTNDGVDVLFIGYSPERGVLTGIWMGNDDNRPAAAATSGLAATLWGRYMAAIGAPRG